MNRPLDMDQNELLNHAGEIPPIGSYYNPKDGMGRFYAPVPDWLMPRREITSGGKLFFALLIQLCPKTRGETTGSQRDFAKRMGVTDRCIRKYNAELTDNHLVEIIRVGKQQHNIYRFLLHPWMAGGTK